jgi:hypothetical protein
MFVDRSIGQREMQEARLVRHPRAKAASPPPPNTTLTRLDDVRRTSTAATSMVSGCCTAIPLLSSETVTT